MNKKDFDNLEEIEQVEYINKRLRESNKTSKEICKQIGIGSSTVSERFKKNNYVFDRKVKQYVLEQIEGQENIFNNDNVKVIQEPQEGEEVTRNINAPLENKPLKMANNKETTKQTTKQTTKIIQLKNQFNDNEFNILKNMINDYATNKNTTCSIKIENTETTVTSLRLNKELYMKVKEKAAAEKIGITDIMNNIMLDYLNK